MLVGVGEGAIAPVAKALPTSQGAGRECLVEALSRLDDTPKNQMAMRALVESLKGASASEERFIADVVLRADKGSAAPVDALSDLLRSAQATPADRARAARLLGRLDGPASRAVLIAAAGDEQAAVRAAIVQALSGG